MKRLLFMLLGLSGVSYGTPLSTIGTFCGSFPDQCRKGTESLLAARGIGTDAYYVLEVDPATGAIPTTAVFSITSEGTPGAAAPAKALQVAGTDGTDLRVLKTDTAGDQVVIGLGTAGTPAGGVVTVQGVTSMTALKVDGSAVTQPVSGTFWQATQPVSGTFFQATQPVSAASLPLPSGASTEATLAAQSAKLPATLGQKTMAASMAVVIASDQSAVPVSGTVTATGTVAATQSGTWTVQPGNTANTTAWKVDGSAVTQPVSIAAAPLSPGGRAYADSVRYTYVTAAVGTTNWVQLIASTAAVINCIELFDSSGQTLELGTGAAASETRVLIIPPGGLDACIPLKISASTRVSIRALSATTGAIGEIDITGFN